MQTVEDLREYCSAWYDGVIVAVGLLEGRR